MTLNIKSIEKKLKKQIARNTFSVGVDTASVTGIATIETNNDTLKINTLTFKLPIVKKEDELSDKFVEKLEFMLRNIRDFKKTIKSKKASILVLENSYLALNPLTFGLLRMLCGIVFAELFDYFEKINIIFPLTARKIVGFKSQLKRGTKREERKKEIIDWINNLFDLKETDDNICDALILALVGLLK